MERPNRKKTARTLGALAICVLFLAGTIPVGQAEQSDRPTDVCSWEIGSPPVDVVCIDLCKTQFSDLSDIDGDDLSDQVESCFLGTDLANPDTDGDKLPDGMDSTPFLDGELPVRIEIIRVEQVHPGQKCDEDTQWDPYFDGFGFDIPAVDEDISLRLLGWSRVDHVHQRPDRNFNFIAAKESGTGSVNGNTVNLNIDPNVQRWTGGELKELELFLTFGALLVDHDHHKNGNDDYMEFHDVNRDILKLGSKNVPTFTSEHAYDADTPHIHCQGEVALQVFFDSLTEQILDTANANMKYHGSLIKCTTPGMNRCIPDGSWG